jgi:Trypsin-like peptidase domain
MTKNSRTRCLRDQLKAGVDPQQIEYVKGKLPSHRRPFPEVVSDLREAVYAIIRLRPTGNGRADVKPLGSGFFISHSAFVTCNHCMNPVAFPHQDGDTYRLVNNLASDIDLHAGRTIDVGNVVAGQNLHLYPTKDFAVLEVDVIVPKAWISLDFSHTRSGRAIGVAGYPLPNVRPTPDGNNLEYSGLAYRVAQNVVTATYNETLTSRGCISPISNVPIAEVNFLFVSGNSGGPVFDAETGRVIAFVHGYRAVAIEERLAPTKLVATGETVERVLAVYSVAIRVQCVEAELKQFGGTI